MLQVKKDLQGLCQLAMDLGATNAVSFNARDVVVDERVRLKCRIPVCDDYGLNLMCPPYVMNVQEFRDVITKYRWAILIQIETPIPPELKTAIELASDVATLYANAQFVKSYQKSLDPVKSTLHQIVQKIEGQAFMLGYRFATGFQAGSCKLCSECVVPHSEGPCRHPYQARPAMEAVGIDVFKTAENAGLPFEMPLRTTIVWNGLVLVT